MRCICAVWIYDVIANTLLTTKFESSSTFVLLLDGSTQVELIDFRFMRMETLYVYIATPLDHEFLFSMVVA